MVDGTKTAAPTGDLGLTVWCRCTVSAPAARALGIEEGTELEVPIAGREDLAPETLVASLYRAVHGGEMWLDA